MLREFVFSESMFKGQSGIMDFEWFRVKGMTTIEVEVCSRAIEAKQTCVVVQRPRAWPWGEKMKTS